MSVCIYKHRCGLKLATRQYVPIMLYKIYMYVYTCAQFQFVCPNFLSLFITPSGVIISLTNGHFAAF